MEYGTVGVGAFSALILMAVVGLVMPIAVAIVWVVKTKQKITTVLIGAATFIVFAMGLETIPKYFLMGNGSTLANYIMSHAWSFALVAAGLAGIFEETGRYIAFRFILRRRTEKETAITYGIGHGGIEAIIVLGFSAITYISYAVMINQGVYGVIVDQVAAVSPEQVKTMEALAASLTSMSFGIGIAGCIERVLAMIIHISCSVLVFKAVREKNAWYYFPIAIVAHGFVDVFAALYQFGIIKSIYGIEALIAVLAGVLGYAAIRVYKKMKCKQ